MNHNLRIAYLYPAEMNIYGDRGNIIALQKRCSWRGIATTVDEINLGQKYDFTKADIIFGGGGQDKGQELVAEDLQRHGPGLTAASESGTPMLLICGLYQLFGQQFKTAEGKLLKGIGVFNASTKAGPTRLIGNIVSESQFGQLVGFENHSGLTQLEETQKPLGQVTKGSGNDGESGHEGAIVNNVVGTYLHGPALPKNPRLADFLIEAAMRRRYDIKALDKLHDGLEHKAAEFAAKLS